MAVIAGLECNMRKGGCWLRNFCSACHSFATSIAVGEVAVGRGNRGGESQCGDRFVADASAVGVFELLMCVFSFYRTTFMLRSRECTVDVQERSFLVRLSITTEDVRQLCAEKFEVDKPAECSPFLVVDDTWQQLTEHTCPREMKAELHSCPQPQVFHFVYKCVNRDLCGAICHNDDSTF